MKTKYIKVSVKERFPEETEAYMTSHGWFTWDHGEFYNDTDEVIPYVNYWLEEIPDREDELKEILTTYIEEFKAWNFSAENVKKAEQILKKLS